MVYFSSLYEYGAPLGRPSGRGSFAIITGKVNVTFEEQLLSNGGWPLLLEFYGSKLG